MKFPRSYGTIAHPTSFPSPFGIGDLGPAARTFIDFLSDSGQSIWQLLPLNPVGHGYSPYNSYSAFAGNPYLISPELLAGKELLETAELDEFSQPFKVHADFELAFESKNLLLQRASRRFYQRNDLDEQRRLDSFIAENRHWLDDYTLFMTLLEERNFKPWNRWEEELAARKGDALARVRNRQSESIRHHQWLQFEFYSQWEKLKTEANRKGVRIMGDLPIFVAHNSADVWANSRYFTITETGDPIYIAGVPPDYFSESGQLWGNPLYDWNALKEEDYKWWIERFRHNFQLFDLLRVDHFRGFESFWRVDAGKKDAREGDWIKSPGDQFFATLNRELGSVPIIAEDLGLITPEVRALRDRFSFPGMNVLHFAFDGDPANTFLPHNYRRNSLVYTGTHDNNTTIGWYQSAPGDVKHRMRVYTRSDGSMPHWELIRLALFSVSDQALVPLQDYMGLDSSHRMNTPGTVGENWRWRYSPEMLDRVDLDRIRRLGKESNRLTENSASF